MGRVHRNVKSIEVVHGRKCGFLDPMKADKRAGSRFNRGHRTVGGQVKHEGSKGNWIWGWRIVTVNDQAQKVSDGGERAGINLVVRFHHPPLDYIFVRTD